jgi:hypothetical protein
MNENLTIDEYIQTKPDSVKDLIVTSLRVLDTFTKLTYDGKSFEKIISVFTFRQRYKNMTKLMKFHHNVFLVQAMGNLFVWILLMINFYEFEKTRSNLQKIIFNIDNFFYYNFVVT